MVKTRHLAYQMKNLTRIINDWCSSISWPLPSQTCLISLIFTLLIDTVYIDSHPHPLPCKTYLISLLYTLSVEKHWSPFTPCSNLSLYSNVLDILGIRSSRYMDGPSALHFDSYWLSTLWNTVSVIYDIHFVLSFKWTYTVLLKHSFFSHFLLVYSQVPSYILGITILSLVVHIHWISKTSSPQKDARKWTKILASLLDAGMVFWCWLRCWYGAGTFTGG